MRVALLSTLEPCADDPATPRGLLRLGGRSIVHHQLSVALALGCERIVCLGDGLPGALIAVQQAAEREGAAFQLVPDGRAVARLIGPGDELLVFADGLVAPAEAISTLLGGRAGIVVQPVEAGLGRGYERIDLNHAAAGIVRLPGRLAAGLAEVPPDWNPVSALLRIAVQAGLRQVPLTASLAQGPSWALLRSDAEAHALEPKWLRQRTAGAEDIGPGGWLAARLTERVGPALLHAGTRPAALAAAAAAIALLGLLVAWFGWQAPGFVLLGLAWLTRRAGAMLAGVHRPPRSRRPRWLALGGLFDVLLDAAIAAVAVWRSGAASPETVAAAAFAVVVLIGLLRVIVRVFAARRWAPAFADRLVLALGLAAASLSGVFVPAVMLAALGLLVFALIVADAPPSPAGADTAPPSRLTPP